jgi:hypothetical protein
LGWPDDAASRLQAPDDFHIVAKLHRAPSASNRCHRQRQVDVGRNNEREFRRVAGLAIENWAR